MRKMASIRTIKELRPIAGADQIELAIIDGWQTVVKKGDFAAGQQVVFLEIDSWVPTAVAPFLTKGAKVPREFEGVQGERLRTIKLRGEVSQGLVLPLSVIPREAMDAINAATIFEGETAEGTPVYSSIDGWDVTEALGVKKWERDVPAQMRGNARRYFPDFIQKTDQERVQNRLRTIENRPLHEVFEATLKRDGSSTTFYHYNGDVGVCSRNLELKTDESNADNLFVKMYHELRIAERLTALGYNIALQGELWGTGINGNWENVNGVFFNLFDVFDCDKHRYVDRQTRLDVLAKINAIIPGAPAIEHVPVIGVGTLPEFGLREHMTGAVNIDHFLHFADRPSTHNPIAEGVVFKSLTDPNFTFKVINNKYLLEGGN